MNNYIDMNDVEQLIIDRLTGQIGDEEDSRLEQLITRHHEVEQLWQQMQQVFAMRKAVSFDNSFNADAAWQSLQQKVSLPDTPQHPQPDTVALPERNRSRASVVWMRVGMAAAVAGIIAVSIFIFSYLYRQHPQDGKSIHIQLANGQTMQAAPEDKDGALLDKARQTKSDPTAWNTLTVPAGKMYSLTLDEGTEVWLNAASELKFPLAFTGLRRDVQLKGEGYFKVSHKPDQPFVVTVNGLTVTALGTAFNIKSYTSETSSIALITGSVAVRDAKGHQVILQAGEAVIADVDHNILRKESFDEVNVLGWIQGLYYFHDEKLNDIAVIAERWFDVPVLLNDAVLKDMRFTGALDRNKPMNFFLDYIATSGNLRYEMHKGKVVFHKH